MWSSQLAMIRTVESKQLLVPSVWLHQRRTVEPEACCRSVNRLWASGSACTRCADYVKRFAKPEDVIERHGGQQSDESDSDPDNHQFLSSR